MEGIGIRPQDDMDLDMGDDIGGDEAPDDSAGGDASPISGDENASEAGDTGGA